MQRLKELPLAGIASLLLGYITFTGAAWHLGYWSTFKFNYLEYANIGDLFKSSIYLLLSDVWIFLVLFTVSAGLTAPLPLLLQPKRKHNPNNPPLELKVGRTLLLCLIGLSTLAILYFGGILSRNNPKWNFMAFAFAILFGTMLFMTKFLKNEMKDEFSRLFLFILIFFIPFFSYESGKKKSIKAKTLFMYTQVESIKTTDTLLDNILVRSAYLGASSNHYFFYRLHDKVIVVNADKVEWITLKDQIDDQNYMPYMKY